MDVKIKYSEKRFRTVSARMVDGGLLVSAPSRIPAERLAKIVENLKRCFERRQLKEKLNRARPLAEIAARINEKYFDGKLMINSIEYAADQNSKFGCCNYREAKIRISHRLSRMPVWVRDYVIIHEMAHLIEPNHSASFWKIVSRYRLAERARGYLIATGLENVEENGPERDCVPDGLKLGESGEAFRNGEEALPATQQMAAYPPFRAAE